jgi:S-DNA-T family DNA segregation ATPase FtsK/SpoIIIE
MAGAGGLLILLVFLTLALASYTQTDPSGSTAASGNDIRNWMGASGAWAADKVLGTFGITSVLLLPLIYIGARGLWREVEHEDEDKGTRWWLPLGMLLVAMVLLSTFLSLMFEGPDSTLPAQMGGISGLLGASAVNAVADRFGEGTSGWVTGGLVFASLAGGIAIFCQCAALARSPMRQARPD